MNTATYQRYVNDPNQLLNDIDAQLEQVPIGDLPLLPLNADEPVERGVREGRPRHSVMELILSRSTEAFRKTCCTQLQYCAARKKYADTVALIQTVADTLISAVVKFPIPVATVASYCVLSLFLDRVCKCQDGAAQSTLPCDSNSSSNSAPPSPTKSRSPI